LEGVFPMVTGKVYKEVASPTDIRDEGLYLWSDRSDSTKKELDKQYRVKVLIKKKLGEKTAQLAFIVPDAAGKKL
jgi:hypothetical protein